MNEHQEIFGRKERKINNTTEPVFAPYPEDDASMLGFVT
jgi:hypothetical protein